MEKVKEVRRDERRRVQKRAEEGKDIKERKWRKRKERRETGDK